MPRVDAVVHLTQPPARVFDLLAKPAAVAGLSPPGMRLQLLSGPERLNLGARCTWKGRRWGVSRRVVTEVTAFEEDQLIVEEQREGPFACWVHRRRFEPEDGGTRLFDEIDFDPPTGMLGRLLTAETMEKELAEALRYRNEQLPNVLDGMGE